MKKLLAIALLLALTACAATRIPFTHTVRSSVYRFVITTSEKSALGTAFVLPGMASLLLTAGHNVTLEGGKTFITNGESLIPVQVLKSDPALDIALVRTFEELPLQEPNFLRWAGRTPQIGDRIVIGCIPGAMREKQFLLFTPGEVMNNDETAWEPGVDGKYFTIASPAVLLGCSGGPALNERGEIVGMLVKGYTEGGTVNMIVPAKVLRDFI